MQIGARCKTRIPGRPGEGAVQRELGRVGGEEGVLVQPRKNASNRSRGVPPPRSTLRDLDAIKQMAILRLTATHETDSRAWNAPFLRHHQGDSRWQIFHTGLPYQEIGGLLTRFLPPQLEPVHRVGPRRWVAVFPQATMWDFLPPRFGPRCFHQI